MRRASQHPREPLVRWLIEFLVPLSLPAGQGLNAESGDYEDMVKAGIIDPAMVTRSALQNAASIAKNILTTECIVADKPEPAGNGGGGMPGGGMPPGMM